MRELDYLTSILLGILQGLTEFLPISSSGHLALSQRFLNLPPHSPEMLLYDVLVHLATLIAVLYVFAPQIGRFADRLRRELSATWTGRRYATRIALLAIVGTIPTGVIGLSFKDTFEEAFDRPVWIGIGLLITGFMLALLPVVPRGRRGWRQFTWWQALLVGTFQAAAIFPGISRSGATICAASYTGLRRRWAAEFSFLLAIPAILGGVVFKVRDTIKLPEEELAGLAWGPIAVGSIVAMVVGVVALRWLLSMVRRARLHYFALYCWLAGAATLLWVR